MTKNLSLMHYPETIMPDAAALFNPSAVLNLDQSDIPVRAVRFT